jgi:hypothetical protein
MKLSTAKNYFEDFHKDGEADKFIDLFPTDKYRTDNLSIPLFKFDYSAFPVNSSHISYFDKNLKNPKANELPLQERVPLTHYKTEEIKQPHVEDVFENNIIQNQKNIKIPKKELPEKYAYGLDHKGLGDIAYERLDIENGDTNELSRNLENFYENQYLKQVEPEKMRKLENIEKGIKKHGNNPDKQDKIGRALERKEEIINVEIPEILGKNPKYHDDKDIYQKYRPLQNKTDRVLSQKELYEINNILISKGQKPLPVGTRSKAAARKINLINDSFGIVNEAENAATKIQAKVRQTKVTNLKKDPEFKRRVQNRIEDRENEGKALKLESEALKLEGAVAKAQKLARKKLSTKTRSEGVEESKSARNEPPFDDFQKQFDELKREREEIETRRKNQNKKRFLSKISRHANKKDMKNLKDSLKAGFEEMARKKGEMKLSPMSAGGGGAKSPIIPMSAGGGDQSPIWIERDLDTSSLGKQNMMNYYIKVKRDGDPAIKDFHGYFQPMSNDEILSLIENFPLKVSQREKEEILAQIKSSGGGGAKSPMSAGGGGAKSTKIKHEQDFMNSLITLKKMKNLDADKAIDNILYNFDQMSNDEILTLIEKSPTKTTQQEKEEILERIKSSAKTPTPSKTPSSTKMGKKEQEKQAGEIVSGIPIILSDFEKNIKKVEDIYEVISKTPGEKVTKDQIRTINDFLPPDRKITAGAGRVRVGQALKELEELYIEESRNQKIRQLPGESANIVTPMQTPASKDAKKLIFSTGPRKTSV